MDQQEQKTTFSLYDLMQHLRRVVSFNMRETLWVQAELAEVRLNRGYVYLSIIDRDDFRLRAKSPAIIRPRDLHKIKQRIGDPLWSILKVGQQVLLEVQAVFSELYGMNLEVKAVDVSYTIGQLELQRMKTLKQLEQEQFTDLNRQLALPLVPQRIAIISSKEAAGLRDFLEQLHNNPQHYHFETELFQAAVQGAQLSKEIISQIQQIETQQADFDAIVLVRGGGARLDLMGFDDFELCKAIALCELPVITGIGHDVDETLADLVAHTALKTPTAVADYLVQRVLQFEAALQRSTLDLQALVQQRLQQEQLRLQQYEQRLSSGLQARLKLEARELEIIEQKLKLLSPQATLARGFALLSRLDGQIVQSVQELQAGDELILELKDGQIKVVVRE